MRFGSKPSYWHFQWIGITNMLLHLPIYCLKWSIFLNFVYFLIEALIGTLIKTFTTNIRSKVYRKVLVNDNSWKYFVWLPKKSKIVLLTLYFTDLSIFWKLLITFRTGYYFLENQLIWFTMVSTSTSIYNFSKKIFWVTLLKIFYQKSACTRFMIFWPVLL